jgi:hypothetical protein
MIIDWRAQVGTDTYKRRRLVGAVHAMSSLLTTSTPLRRDNELMSRRTHNATVALRNPVFTTPISSILSSNGIAEKYRERQAFFSSLSG